jgi:hypothetical protein
MKTFNLYFIINNISNYFNINPIIKSVENKDKCNADVDDYKKKIF